MKRLLFLSVLLMSVVICGSAFAAGITGTYILKQGDLEGEMIIKQSGAGYSAEINTYVPNSPPPGIWSGFEGNGTLKDNILTVTQTTADGKSFQIAIQFQGAIAVITEENVNGDFTICEGPSGGPGFAYTYKKK